MEHVFGELNYWIDLMKRWRVEWIAGSKKQSPEKMSSLFA
jgi:hypothetical protein